MSNNANRMTKLTGIAKILDQCDDSEACAIILSYMDLRGLHIGGHATVEVQNRGERSTSRSSRSASKGKKACKPSSTSQANAREARERELGMTSGQIFSATQRLLNIQKKFNGIDGEERAALAKQYGLEALTARQEIGRAIQLCQDMQTWLRGKSYLDRSTGKRTNAKPVLPDSFRRLMGDEGSNSGRNSQD